jgi:beta-xylosidase
MVARGSSRRGKARPLRLIGGLACLGAGLFLPISRHAGHSAPVPVVTYVNPVYARDFPDPHVLFHRGTFYAYATQADDRGFQVMESPDLVRWTHRGAAYKPPWSSRHYWAPEVIHHRGRLWMTYSALNPETGKHDIGIADASSPLGPFRHRAILVRGGDNRVGVIDATIFLERDGTPYLIYSEEDPRRIVLRRMRRDLLALEGETTELVRPNRDWERGVTEAPTLIRRGGLYHLFFSVGWYQSNREDACYAVCHATARSLRGPYTKSPRPLIETVPDRVYGPGHQCLVFLPGGETWLLYHAWGPGNEPRYGSNPLGRTLRLDRLQWRGDQPFVDGPSTTPRPAPRLRALPRGHLPVESGSRTSKPSNRRKSRSVV